MKRAEEASTASVICERDVGHTTRSPTLKSDGGDGGESPVNNWLILSFLWIFDFLISRLVRCFDWRRRAARPWFAFPCTHESWLTTPDPGKHCYFNQTSSDVSLAPVDSTTPASFIPETCIRDLESFCNAIDSLPLSQRYLLDAIRSDRIICTRPDEDRRRRTIIIERKNESFGFSLQVLPVLVSNRTSIQSYIPLSIQTYGIRHKEEDEVELLTYVDRVDILGPAFKGNLFKLWLQTGLPCKRRLQCFTWSLIQLRLLSSCFESRTKRRRCNLIDQRTGHGKG